MFEGGAHPNDRPNVETADNSERLRQAFSKLLNSGLKNEKVRIVAAPMHSNRNLKTVASNWSQGEYILIDLDAPESHKPTFIENQKLAALQDHVFFMVQEMEAWILSQPEAIDRVFAHLKSANTPIADEEALQVGHPSLIVKPYEKLHIILGRHFEYEKAGRKKKQKYGKLKDGPALIEGLDVESLKASFEDLKMMLARIDAFKP